MAAPPREKLEGAATTALAATALAATGQHASEHAAVAAPSLTTAVSAALAAAVASVTATFSWVCDLFGGCAAEAPSDGVEFRDVSARTELATVTAQLEATRAALCESECAQPAVVKPAAAAAAPSSTPRCPPLDVVGGFGCRGGCDGGCCGARRSRLDIMDLRGGGGPSTSWPEIQKVRRRSLIDARQD